MELLAPIKALELFSRKEKIKIFTDSTYVKNGITIWIKNWEKNNWKTYNKKKVKNIELWKKLNKLSNCPRYKFKMYIGYSLNNPQLIM